MAHITTESHFLKKGKKGKGLGGFRHLVMDQSFGQI